MHSMHEYVVAGYKWPPAITGDRWSGGENGVVKMTLRQLWIEVKILLKYACFSLPGVFTINFYMSVSCSQGYLQ